MKHFINEHIGFIMIYSIFASAFGLIAYCSNSAQANDPTVTIVYEEVEINGAFAYQN
jgi:hypothetical protein